MAKERPATQHQYQTHNWTGVRQDGDFGRPRDFCRRRRQLHLSGVQRGWKWHFHVWARRYGCVQRDVQGKSTIRKIVLRTFLKPPAEHVQTKSAVRCQIWAWLFNFRPIRGASCPLLQRASFLFSPRTIQRRCFLFSWQNVIRRGWKCWESSHSYPLTASKFQNRRCYPDHCSSWRLLRISCFRNA